MHISQISCIYFKRWSKLWPGSTKKHMTPTNIIYWINRHLFLLSFNRKWNECRFYIYYPLELSWTKRMQDLSLCYPPTLYVWLFKHVKGNIWREMSVVLDFLVSFEDSECLPFFMVNMVLLIMSVSWKVSCSGSSSLCIPLGFWHDILAHYFPSVATASLCNGLSILSDLVILYCGLWFRYLNYACIVCIWQ